MKTFSILLFFFCSGAFCSDKLPKGFDKVIEGVLKTPTVSLYKKNTEKTAFRFMKNNTSLSERQAIALGALGYTAVTGKIDTSKFIRATIRIGKTTINPRLEYSLRETSGQLKFVITIPF